MALLMIYTITQRLWINSRRKRGGILLCQYWKKKLGRQRALAGYAKCGNQLLSFSFLRFIIRSGNRRGRPMPVFVLTLMTVQKRSRGTTIGKDLHHITAFVITGSGNPAHRTAIQTRTVMWHGLLANITARCPQSGRTDADGHRFLNVCHTKAPKGTIIRSRWFLSYGNPRESSDGFWNRRPVSVFALTLMTVQKRSRGTTREDLREDLHRIVITGSGNPANRTAIRTHRYGLLANITAFYRRRRKILSFLQRSGAILQ